MRNNGMAIFRTFINGCLSNKHIFYTLISCLLIPAAFSLNLGLTQIHDHRGNIKTVLEP